MRERTRKWVRRHPRLTSRSSIAAMVCTLVLCCAAPFAVEAWGEWQDANARKLQDALADARQADEEKRRLEETVSATDRDRRSQKDALEKLSKFEDDTPSSRPIMEIVSVLQMLPEAWPHEEKLLAAAMAECRRWLQFYDVLDDADWQRQPAVRDLPPAERERLRLKITELLYALAHAEQASLARLRDETRPFTMVSSAAMITGFGLEIRGALEATVRARFLPAERLNEQACTCFDNQIWYLARQKLELTQLRDNGKTLEPFLVDKLPPRGELDERCWAARMLIAEGRFAVALPLLDQATALSPDHSEAWLLMAWCHYNLKNARKAEFCYDSYLDLQPTSIWGYYGRGLFFLSEKNWASAERDFGWVVKQLPDLAWAYSHRASARKGMGKDAGAIKDLTHAIDLAPEVPGFYLLRAQLHAAVGNRELAEQDRRRFLQHEPNGFVGWLYRGIARRSTDPQGALADFEKALALNPRDPLTLLNKARLLADAFGRPREAIKVLNEVIELEPDLLVLDARFQRGMILAKTGQRDRAVDDAEQLIRREPTPSRCYEAASIYASTSRKDDAVLALQLLRFALRHGHGVSKYQTDPNLRSLANLAEFRRLAEGLRILGAQDPFPPGK
jgi:tetratricopeptide (TPR) repeat protein